MSFTTVLVMMMFEPEETAWRGVAGMEGLLDPGDFRAAVTLKLTSFNGVKRSRYLGTGAFALAVVTSLMGASVPETPMAFRSLVAAFRNSKGNVQVSMTEGSATST